MKKKKKGQPEQPDRFTPEERSAGEKSWQAFKDMPYNDDKVGQVFVMPVKKKPNQ